MPFDEIDISATAAPSNETGVRASLAKIRGAPAKLRLTVRDHVLADMEWGAKTRLRVLIGNGGDHGIIRLVDADDGPAQFRERSMKGVRFWALSIGHIPALVDRSEKAAPCRWERIDDATMEIVLPGWADETKPRPAAKILAKSPAEIAAMKERDRLEQERREAEERRKKREGWIG